MWNVTESFIFANIRMWIDHAKFMLYARGNYTHIWYLCSDIIVLFIVWVIKHDISMAIGLSLQTQLHGYACHYRNGILNPQPQGI